MEFSNKIEYLTERFGVTASIRDEGIYSEINFEQVDQVEKDKFEAVQQATLYLEYEELDKLIKILEFTKQQLLKDDE